MILGYWSGEKCQMSNRKSVEERMACDKIEKEA